MYVFGFTTNDSTVKPAVVILVKPKTVHDWKTAAQKLSYILWGFPGISIEFLPGYVGDVPGRSFAGIPNRIQSTPTMGSSIGEVGQHGGGTLGGFVTLEGNGFKHHGFLTNHHVVRPYSSPPHVIHDINKVGYGTKSLTTNIQYPAKDDLKATVDGVNAEVETVKTQMMDLELKVQRFGWKGEPVPRTFQSNLDFEQQNLAAQQNLQAQLQALPSTLGKVLFSSGDAISPTTSILDWAFVASPPHRNKLPSRDAPGLSNKLASSYGITGAACSVVDNPPSYAKEFSTMEPGKWYFKQGRATDITTGLCHGVEVDINRTGKIRFDEQGKEVKLGLGSTKELVILDKQISALEGNAYPFCEGGDSGSFILDHRGRVAGLMYGEFTGFCGPPNRGRTYMGAGLVTSMEEVLASIKAKTGAELFLS